MNDNHGNTPVSPPPDPLPLRDQIIEDLRAEFLSPLKLISYPILIGFFFPFLTVDWPVTSVIFSSLWIPLIATVGLVAFNERDLRREMKFWDWIYLVFILCLGAFTVEFVGIAIHTLTSLFHGQHNLDINFWDGVAIAYSIIGGISLSVSHSIGKRYRRKNISSKSRVFLIIPFTVFLVLSWIFEYQQNPHDPLRVIISYLQIQY